VDTRLQILSSGSGSGRECQRKRGREARRSRGGWIRERVSASASASPNPRGGDQGVGCHGGGASASDFPGNSACCVRVLYSRSAALYLSTERRAADDETRQRCGGGGGGGGGGGALCRGVSGRRTPPPRSPQQRQLYLQNRPRQPASCAAAIGCSAMASQRVSGAYGGGCNSFFFFFFFISFSGVPSRQFSLVSNRRTAYVCVRSM